ncbi:bifunctional diguanylate cyclase/phosphodiesterase [Mycobacterium sp. 236(2023)]|uniref:bifunctional diguanylate cyclase/phosphodiesterase n=1 Tax=Mycobacterium sp. 236(2023) TaxID=3038163 RepID=UPI0024153503|nr:bifunctional diguanylate cyclase/phosphodiesterase [Mycobacterium sp. 236(2023)]MDG4665728.1 bifunctional diguanylate cyclase/phosphodiesterase [Mycobacterium sp. 236(2023)]
MAGVRAGWAAVKRAQMWPGIATSLMWARTAGSCFLFGGVLIALITTLAPAHFDDAALQYTNAAIATSIGLTVLWTGSRVTLWQFHVLVVAASLQITASVLGSTGIASVSVATLFVFIACSAFFVAWPTAAAHVAVGVVCCVAALSFRPDVPWFTGVVTAAVTAAIGTLIIILGQSVAKAELDDATGVLNRRGFDRAIAAEIGQAHTEEAGPAVILICVDSYAAIHTEFGDHAGDELMQQLATLWLGVLTPEQVLARRANDEFIVMLPEATEQEALALTQRLRVGSSQEFSAGVSAWDVGESAAHVLKRADIALRRARSVGRNHTMLESAHLPTLAVQLRDALTEESVGVHYQPIVRLAEGYDVVGVEALMRWTPIFGPDLQAGEVIRVAEDNDLIAALDQYVLRRACLDALWMQQKTPQLRLSLSVNVSGLELVEKGYVDRVLATLAETGWPATQLVLEVTETVIDVDRPSSILALHELRTHGIRIAIDDFGTGYSSLSRLQKLPTDLLKLDATFIASISSASSSSPPLLHAVAGLADALSLPIVAEGVETAHEANVLRGMGFALAQGFYFGRPQTREGIVGVISRAAG